MTQALRRRGLNLRTSKTEMMPRSDAKNRIEGVIPVIETVQERYRKLMKELLGNIDPYLPLVEIDDPNDAPLFVVQEAFVENFLKDDTHFNTSLFHYILKRLADHRAKFALNYCLKQLYIKPQETQPILEYIALVGAHDEAQAAILKFLQSQDNIYEYQRYQIFRWVGNVPCSPLSGLLTLARQLTFDLSRPSYLRSVCRKLLGEHGTIADLDRLEGSYADVREDLEAAQVLISLKRMEVGRRNAFYGRVEGDGLLRGRAVRLVRQSRL